MWLFSSWMRRNGASAIADPRLVCTESSTLGVLLGFLWVIWDALGHVEAR